MELSKVVVHGLSVSLDGYVAGLHQDEDNPIGVGGSRLHEWIFATKSGRQMIGQSGGSDGVDEGFFQAAADEASVTIMGRNMFGPVRGPWSEPEWRGWWGDVPPFHHPVFVLTHFARPPLEMDGGTTFHFVTKGIPDALARAREVAGDGDIQVGGGAMTVRAFLKGHLVDELNLAVVPIRLEEGERIFAAVGEWPDGYSCRNVVEGEGATHYQLVRS